MRTLSILAVTAVAVAVASLPDQTASAQDYTSGYGFGLGFDIGRQTADFPGVGPRRHFHYGQFGPTPRFEEPPYFAKFPPVYYSGIVRRAYGVSPFAVPPGIQPVEQCAPMPVTISNPYFVPGEVAPTSIEAQPSTDNPAENDSNDNKQTSHESNWTENAYYYQNSPAVAGSN